jgi:hypothetical protein
MHLIEIFVPLADNDGSRFPQDLHERVRHELADRFGGVTAYPRAPAKGLWKMSPSETQQDDLVIYEVMAATLDEAWWADYRRQLESVFRQEKLLIRAQQVHLL